MTLPVGICKTSTSLDRWDNFPSHMYHMRCMQHRGLHSLRWVPGNEVDVPNREGTVLYYSILFSLSVPAHVFFFMEFFSTPVNHTQFATVVLNLSASVDVEVRCCFVLAAAAAAVSAAVAVGIAHAFRVVMSM